MTDESWDWMTGSRTGREESANPLAPCPCGSAHNNKTTAALFMTAPIPERNNAIGFISRDSNNKDDARHGLVASGGKFLSPTSGVRMKAVLSRPVSPSQSSGSRFRHSRAIFLPEVKVTKPIPEGYHSVTPYLIVDGAAQAIEYYARAFDAVEVLRMPGPDGRVGHAEIRIGDSIVMMADEHPEIGVLGPRSRGGVTGSFLIYVENVDAVFDRAISAGGRVLKPLQDQFYGDRSGTLEDPFGHSWTIATHKEDVSPEELDRRMRAMTQKGE